MLYIKISSFTFFLCIVSSFIDNIRSAHFPLSGNKDNSAGVLAVSEEKNQNNFKDITEGSFNAGSFGLFAIKGDVTNQLQSALNNPAIKKIIFQQEQKSKLLINGNVHIPDDKVLEFDGSVIVGGTGSITGGVINAPAGIQIFNTSLNLSGIKVKGNSFSAAWFGAKGDGKTFNDIALRKSFSAAPAGTTVYLPSGELLIKQTLDITHSLTGDTASTIKLEPDSLVRNIVMTRVKASGISIKNISFDGSNKALWIMEIINGQSNVEIANCTISGAEQIADAKMYAAGIRFREGADGLHIHDCNFSNINAANTGVARGLVGSGKVSPKNVIIEKNTFDGVTSNGAKNWDADQIVIQDYPDSSGMIIRYNKHKNISKRGEKLQSPGILSYMNECWSTRYKTENKRSYAAISAYAFGTTISNNTIWEGVFENGIEVGVINGTGYNNITVTKNKLYLSQTDLGSNDGIRIFGKQITNLNVSDNYIQNVRKGIWLDCNTTAAIVQNNEVHNTTDNAYAVDGSSNKWPDTWNYNLTFANNKATNVKANTAFNLSKITDAIITGNSADSIKQSAFNKNALDSLTGKIIMHDNKGSGNVNSGSSQDRPVIKNPSACIGLQFYNTDSKKTEVWDGKDWKKKE
ncbi:MAG: hypothetical protein QM802_24190 [Agriterribacter sp.]